MTAANVDRTALEAKVKDMYTQVAENPHGDQRLLRPHSSGRLRQSGRYKGGRSRKKLTVPQPLAARSGFLVTMPVMQIGIMRVGVENGLVRMPMRVRYAQRVSPPVLVLMM